jgi:protein-S-isoprenylcysteine O-methyltransferase Ste14
MKNNQLFKPAKSRNGIWNVVKTFLQTMVFWFVFLYLLPSLILKIASIYNLPDFVPQVHFGWILFLCFSLLGLYSGYTMSWNGKGTPLPLDCPNELVIKGPYKIVRNPMAVAGIGQGICVGIITGSYWIILYALIGGVLWHYFVRPVEEKDLEERFGLSYLEYKKVTKCWIPF